MHERGRRASDRDAQRQRRKDDLEQTDLGQETGLCVFPLFADPPFLVWQHRHQKSRQYQQLHPSARPLILLWDEVNGALPDKSAPDSRRKGGVRPEQPAA
jgi:hypothetical protein